MFLLARKFTLRKKSVTQRNVYPRVQEEYSKPGVQEQLWNNILQILDMTNVRHIFVVVVAKN